MTIKTYKENNTENIRLKSNNFSNNNSIMEYMFLESDSDSEIFGSNNNNKIYNNNMNKQNSNSNSRLQKLSKSELIKKIMNQRKPINNPTTTTYRKQYY